MIKAAIFAIIGAGAMYLYLNPGDIEGLKTVLFTATNELATTVKEATD